MTGRVVAEVGEVTNSAITARARVLGRATDRAAAQAERDARIEAAAARVAAAGDAIRANGERRALAVAAAERAIATAERDERDANAGPEGRILAAVRELRADGLTVASIAALLQLPVPRVRQLIKQPHGTAGATDGPGSEGAGGRTGPG